MPGRADSEYGHIVDICPICGIECRTSDDIVVAGDHRMHAACAEAPAAPKRRKVGAWAAMGTRGQMAMGDVQRETPTWDH